MSLRDSESFAHDSSPRRDLLRKRDGGGVKRPTDGDTFPTMSTGLEVHTVSTEDVGPRLIPS